MIDSALVIKRTLWLAGVILSLTGMAPDALASRRHPEYATGVGRKLSCLPMCIAATSSGLGRCRCHGRAKVGSV